MREMEMKASHRRAEFLSCHCSTAAISQLNIQVSLSSLFRRRRVLCRLALCFTIIEQLCAIVLTFPNFSHRPLIEHVEGFSGPR
jgi:hypothetical protein